MDAYLELVVLLCMRMLLYAVFGVRVCPCGNDKQSLM